MGELILRLVADIDQFAQGLNQARGHFRVFSQDLTAQATTDRTRLAENLQRYTVSMNRMQRELIDLQKLRANVGAAAFLPNDQARMDRLLQVLGHLKVRISETRQELGAVNQAAANAYRQQSSLMNLVNAQITAQLQSLVNAGTMLRQVGGIFRNLAIPLLAFTAAITAGAMKVGALGAEYSQTIDIVRSSLGDMVSPTVEAEERFASLVRVIEDLGEKLKFTTSEVAVAAKFLAQAGLSTTEVMAALPGTLNLALSGMLELSRAAEISADFMNAFQLSGSQVSMVADVMAKTAVIANTSVEQLGNAFSFVTPVAATMGQSIQDVAAALAALSNSAIKSSRAGTGLAQILSGLVKDQDKTQALLEKYGSSFERVNPQVVSLINIIEEFKRVGVSAGDVMKFFGERAGRSMLALMNLPTAELAKFREQINDSFGAALEQASRRWQNLSGAIAEFQSKLEAIALAIFNAVKGDILESMKTLTDWLGKVASLLREAQWQPYIRAVVAATVALAGFTAGLGALLLVGFLVLTAIGGTTAAFASMAISANSASAALIQAQVSENLAAAQALALATANTAAGASYNRLAAAALASATALRTSLATTGAGAGAGTGAGALATWQLGLMRIRQAVGFIGVSLVRLSVPLTSLVTLALAFYAAWQPLENGMAKTASVSGALAAIWGVLKGAANALVEGFKFVQKSMADLFADVGISAWDLLVHTIRELGQSLSDLFGYLSPLIVGFSGLLGVLLGIGAAVLKVGLDAFLLLLAGSIKAVQLLTTGVSYLAIAFLACAEGVMRLGSALAWVFSAKLSKEMDDAADALARLRKEVAEVNKEAANAPRNKNDDINTLKVSRIEGRKYKDDTLSLQSYLNLLEKADKALYDMTASELLQLERLSQKYGDVNDEVANIVKFADSQIPKLQAIADATAEDSEQNRGAKNSIAVLQDMKRQAQETQAQFEALKAAGSDAVGPDMANNARNLADNIAELERRASEAAEAGKQLQESTTKYYQLRDRVMESELAGYEKEIFELSKLTKAYEEATEARKASMASRVSALEQDVIQQTQKKQAALDYYDKVLAEKRAETELVPGWTPEQKDTEAERLAKGAAADYARSSEGLLQTQTTLAEMRAEQNKLSNELAESDPVLQRKREQIEKKYLDKQREFLQEQKIDAAKAAEDKVLIAELEAEKYVEAERKKIDEIFVLNTEANRQLKAQALAHVDEVAAAKIEKARREAEEERVKERKKMLKEALDPIKTMEEEAAKSVAKHVKGVRELIALYIALHQIRMHQEIEARRGFNIAMKAQEAYIRQQRVAEADPGNALKADLAEKRKRQSLFSAMVAGRRMGIAGLTPEQIDLFMEGSGGKKGAAGSAGGGGITVLMDIKDVLTRIEAILNVTQACVCGGPTATSAVKAANASSTQTPVPSTPSPTPTPAPTPVPTPTPATTPTTQAPPTSTGAGAQGSTAGSGAAGGTGSGPMTDASAADWDKEVKRKAATLKRNAPLLKKIEKASEDSMRAHNEFIDAEKEWNDLTEFATQEEYDRLFERLTLAKQADEKSAVVVNLLQAQYDSVTGDIPGSRKAERKGYATENERRAKLPGGKDYVNAGIPKFTGSKEELAKEKADIAQARRETLDAARNQEVNSIRDKEIQFRQMQADAARQLQAEGKIPRSIGIKNVEELQGKISMELWDSIYKRASEAFTKSNGTSIREAREKSKNKLGKIDKEVGAEFDRANPQPIMRVPGFYGGSPMATEEEAAANGAIGQGGILNRIIPALQALSAAIPPQVQALAPTMSAANMGSSLVGSLVPPSVSNLAMGGAGSASSTQTTNENKTFVITINNNADLGQFKAKFNEIVGEAALV